MAVDYRIDQARRVVFVTLRGKISGGDLFKFKRDVWSRQELKGYDELIDARDAEFVLSSSLASDLHGLAEVAAAMDGPSPSKLAIVSGGDFGFGVGRMYEAYREAAAQGTREVEVFREMEQALAWLGIRGNA